MTKFYTPIPEHRTYHRYFRCTGYETGDFPITTFWNGVRFEGEIPEYVRIFLSNGEPPDFLHPPMSWDIFSERAARRISGLAGDAAQFIDAPIYEESTKKRIPGFKLLNITRRLKCIDAARSLIRYDQENPDRIETMLKYVFDDNLPEDAHLFRAAEFPVSQFFSANLMMRLMTGEVMKNLAFVEFGGEEAVEIHREAASRE